MTGSSCANQTLALVTSPCNLQQHGLWQQLQKLDVACSVLLLRPLLYKSGIFQIAPFRAFKSRASSKRACFHTNDPINTCHFRPKTKPTLLGQHDSDNNISQLLDNTFIILYTIIPLPQAQAYAQDILLTPNKSKHSKPLTRNIIIIV